MRRSRQKPLFHLAISLRSLLYPVTVGMLVLASMSLIVASRSNSEFSQSLRHGITDIAIPVLGALSAPLDSMSSAGSWLGDLTNIHDQNALLKSQNAELMRWQLVARELEAENKALRELVHAVPMGQSSYISSRIISDSSGPYSRSALISAGTNEGVRADQPVVSNAGLVGRVVDAGNRNARVLLLTDVSSRIPVVAEDSRERSILAGNNTNLPNLLYLPDNSNLQVGERIITSSDGGAFPAGIPVGVVESISGNEVKIRPLVDWFRLEYVSVIDFSL